MWSKNGIEYLYPQNLIAAAFSCDPAELSKINLESDPIDFNGIRKSKKELAQFIADRITTTNSLNSELEDFVTRIRDASN